VKGWSRNAVTFGIASAVVTLLFNVVGSATASSCIRGSPLSVLAFLVFVALMAGAGFTTARDGGTLATATIAGLVGASISAIGTISAFVVVVGSISDCTQYNNLGISPQTFLMILGIIAAVIISVIGLAVGAGAGALGGLMGQRPSASGV
jgi:hypothetical protein